MASSVKYVKTYVDVLVKMRTDGTFIPVKVMWDDREFEIDSVVKARNSWGGEQSREVRTKPVFGRAESVRGICYCFAQNYLISLAESSSDRRRYFSQSACEEYPAV